MNNLSVAAIAISLISLGLSAYIAVRDRGHITASARYPKRFNPVSVHAVNSGRRPVTLRRLILKTQDGQSYEYPLLNGETPVRLMESEDYEFPLPVSDTEVQQWAKTKIIKAELVDSYGKKHVVEDMVKISNKYAADRTAPI
jgi:hypothetical protein